MDLPVAISVNHGIYRRDIVNQWLTENIETTDVVRAIYGSTYLFGLSSDAIAFALRFGGLRVYSKVEQMIKDLDETDTN